VHPNAVRVQEALRRAGSTAEVRELADSTHTAAQAAAALGVELGAIVKSLVFVADGRPVLLLVSGDRSADTDKVAGAIGAERVERADADTVRRATGLPIGGVAPVGHPAPLPTLVDTALERFGVVWAAAGTPRAVFPTTFTELVSVTSGQAADLG